MYLFYMFECDFDAVNNSVVFDDRCYRPLLVKPFKMFLSKEIIEKMGCYFSFNVLIAE